MTVYNIKTLIIINLIGYSENILDYFISIESFDVTYVFHAARTMSKAFKLFFSIFLSNRPANRLRSLSDGDNM